MREFSTNAHAVRDQKERAAPTDKVGKATGRAVEGLTEKDSGLNAQDTLAGKKKP